MRFLTLLAKPFANAWQLLAVLSVPAVLLGAFGLNQLGLLTPDVAIPAEIAKFLCEFLFLGILLSLLQLVGLKNKWLTGILCFIYYLTMTADLVLLWYFKERFGAKYLDTLEGGDYNFLTDWRVISYLVLLAVFSFTSVRLFLRESPRKTAFYRLLVCSTATALLYAFNPLWLLPSPADFYSVYMMPPSVVYTTRAVFASQPTARLIENITPDIQNTAKNYNVFSAKQTPVGKNYMRVILIASESLSNKYLHHFNMNIPPQASAPLDKLYENNPSVSLKHVTLSTLYGLSVIFTSHPYVRLAYENQYPFSMVKELKKNGFHTAFLRGADETYMDENILFKQAGFDEVIGATYFEKRADYKDYIDWWGLLDRKLFDYALEYLRIHKNEPTFITVLTVDTHVPLGRLDYLGEKYQEIDDTFYNTSTMPRAFARFGQDVQRFLNGLTRQGLLDDDTLILIMPDHPSYSNTPTNSLFKPYQPEFDNLPFIIVTKDKITAPVAQSELLSQLDIAPTILDLLNMDIPRGMFGHSIFDTHARRTIFDIKEDYAVITTAFDKKVVPLNSKRPQDKELLKLMTTFVQK
ncbi:MAG: LTA synthase family protein [Elusimicrobiaceae bacterium]|nr:LTA synthase family protein [Elusimicrobiaceae bacterium]